MTARGRPNEGLRTRNRRRLQRGLSIALLLVGQMAALSHISAHEFGREDCAVCRAAAKFKQFSVSTTATALAAPVASDMPVLAVAESAAKSVDFAIPQTRAPPIRH